MTPGYYVIIFEYLNIVHYALWVSLLALNVIYISCFTFVLAFEFFFFCSLRDATRKFILLCFQFFVLYLYLILCFVYFQLNHNYHTYDLFSYTKMNKRAFNICSAF